MAATITSTSPSSSAVRYARDLERLESRELAAVARRAIRFRRNETDGKRLYLGLTVERTPFDSLAPELVAPDRRVRRVLTHVAWWVSWQARPTQ